MYRSIYCAHILSYIIIVMLCIAVFIVHIFYRSNDLNHWPNTFLILIANLINVISSIMYLGDLINVISSIVYLGDLFWVLSSIMYLSDLINVISSIMYLGDLINVISSIVLAILLIPFSTFPKSSELKLLLTRVD